MKFVDLFCGGGFGARGAIRGGGKPILAVDSWKIATATYKYNFPQAKVISSNIEDINPSLLTKTVKPDILLTSPECTAHSIARGAKIGSEKSRETAINIITWAKALKPRWIIVENVNRMKKWNRHRELVTSLENLGYRVNDLFLNSADFGTPQSRKRMFLLCDFNGTEIQNTDLIKYHKKINNAESIIDWSNKYESTLLYTKKRAKSTIHRAERAIESLGRNIPFIIVYYGSDYAGGWQRIDTPLRTITTIDRFGLVTWKNNVAYLRMLQPSELIKAMGAGSEHKLPFGSRREKVKLCGNGVCSPVLETLFKIIKQNHEIKNK